MWGGGAGWWGWHCLDRDDSCVTEDRQKTGEQESERCLLWEQLLLARLCLPCHLATAEPRKRDYHRRRLRAWQPRRGLFKWSPRSRVKYLDVGKHSNRLSSRGLQQVWWFCPSPLRVGCSFEAAALNVCQWEASPSFYSPPSPWKMSENNSPPTSEVLTNSADAPIWKGSTIEKVWLETDGPLAFAQGPTDEITWLTVGFEPATSLSQTQHPNPHWATCSGFPF